MPCFLRELKVQAGRLSLLHWPRHAIAFKKAPGKKQIPKELGGRGDIAKTIRAHLSKRAEHARHAGKLSRETILISSISNPLVLLSKFHKFGH
jgi:hypothetical protein